MTDVATEWGGSIVVNQDSYTEAADKSTSSGTYVTLKDYSYTKLTTANNLKVKVRAYSKSSAGPWWHLFRVSIGGVVQDEWQVYMPGAAIQIGRTFYAEKSGDAAGAVSILVEWKVTGGTASISASSVAYDHLVIEIEEIAP